MEAHGFQCELSAISLSLLLRKQDYRRKMRKAMMQRARVFCLYTSRHHSSSQPHQVTVGVVGAGNFGREHCAAIQALDSARLGVMIEPCLKTQQIAKEKFPGVPIFSNLGQVNAKVQIETPIQ